MSSSFQSTICLLLFVVLCAYDAGDGGNSSLVRVQDDRHRSVVDELELHPGTEDARLDRHAERAQLVAEAFVERLRNLRTRGGREARAVPLRRIREQRELADDERGAGHVDERAVEAAVLV